MTAGNEILMALTTCLQVNIEDCIKQEVNEQYCDSGKDGGLQDVSAREPLSTAYRV